MKLKICGMRATENINAVASLSPDFMGFIFYEKSPRNAANNLDKKTVAALPKNIKKIGVFVNENYETISNYITDYQLDGLQLHGKESPELCFNLKQQNLLIFKAFSVDEHFDFEVTKPYKKVVDYFLFDTKGKTGHGGHGVAFDWGILNRYNNEIPFLLAGGIGLENIEDVKKLSHLNLLGIDVNSRFEIEPGLKDIEKLTLLNEVIGYRQ